MNQTTSRVENPAEYERYWVPAVHGPYAAIPSMSDLPGDERERIGAAIKSDVGAGLKPFVDGDALVVHLETRVLTARKPG